MNAETKFYNKIKDHLPGHVQRIESSSGSGVPDVNGCCNGQGEYWLELKIVLEHRGVVLRKEQYAWGMRRNNSGGRVLVIALEPHMEEILFWKYPFEVVPEGHTGKYVLITSSAREQIDYLDRNLIPTIIFKF